MAKEILQKHDSEFMGRPIPDTVTAEKGYELAFPWLPTGMQWRKLRKIFNSHIFMPQELDSLRHLQHDVEKTLVECSVEAQEHGEAIYTWRNSSRTRYRSTFIFNCSDKRNNEDAPGIATPPTIGPSKM
ncbi:UNVERIFIED_CONTAM: hypothetical protein Slati_1703100 [Sesamum latifolium]|uniref:Cytochrome P450 n=1 Tax=Sesamum latifolium TaxID=2727402 RepID=A0AAW2WV53_9LAMI